MKKILISALFLGVALLTGCGKEKEYVTCESIVDSAIEKCSDFPEYSVVSHSDANWEQFYENLYNEYADNVKDFYFIHSSDSIRDEEIVVIRYDSSENASGILSAMEKRKKDRVEDIKGYAGEDIVQMVENGKIGSEDVYAFYVVCDNPKDVYNYCVSMIKED